MKLRKGDKVMVMLGRDKGKTGTVSAVFPKTGEIVVDGVNIYKRHTKPSQKQPRGGILEITKPINASKVMAIDPASGKPARIGFTVKADGTKERIFKVSAAMQKSAKKAEAPKAKAAKTEAPAKKAPAKDGGDK